MNTSEQIQAKDIAIVVPVYKVQISNIERNVLVHGATILSKYPLVLVHPENLDLSVYKDLVPHAQFIPFAKPYFKNLAGYNKLLINDSFYQAFSRYQYLLIFQLDAWVFQDSLLEWCRKGYDYIGAPWLEEPTPGRTSAIVPFTKLCINRVGNGGLSLRKVSSHLHIANRLKLLSRFYNYNEDVFWSLIVPIIFRSYRKPSVLEALHFAFEHRPEECYAKIGNQLPFGCHAWERSGKGFWNKYICIDPE